MPPGRRFVTVHCDSECPRLAQTLSISARIFRGMTKVPKGSAVNVFDDSVE